MTERIISFNEPEYKRFKAVAAMLEAYSKHGAIYVVKDVYLDIGQDWMWTTICREGCQVLCPRDWKAIMSAETPEKLSSVITTIRSDKYFDD